MSGNTSATGGWIIDVPPTIPPSADAVSAGMQTMVSVLTGLPGSLVRPRWQPMPPAQPPVDTTWAAVGVTTVEADNFPYIWHDGFTTLPGQSNPGVDRMQRHATVTVTATFYGPEAENAASQMRDALYHPLNLAPLAPLQMKLYEVHDLARVPEIMNQQYVNRVDLRLAFRMQIDRTYPVFNLDGADFFVTTDHGEQSGGSVRPPPP